METLDGLTRARYAGQLARHACGFVPRLCDVAGADAVLRAANLAIERALAIGWRDQNLVRFYLVGTGRTDIDFHPITDRNWKAMASPAPDAITVLQVPGDATIAQVNAAVQAVASKGGYRYVQVVMRAP